LGLGPGKGGGLRQGQMHWQRLGAGMIGVLVAGDAFEQENLSVHVYLDL
jgi:hypothetical protein